MAHRFSEKRASAASRGFTLIEVMMALTVLTIGLLGVVALQATTISSNKSAQQFTVANAAARTWLQRLRRDANRWTMATGATASDLTKTAWLFEVSSASNIWIRPNASSLEGLASPAFDLNGNDVLLSDGAGQLNNVVYCTHMKLRTIYPDSLIRAEVRVFFKKRTLADAAKYGTYGMTTTGLCMSARGNETTIGLDQLNFHWVYAAAAIQRPDT